MSNYSASAYVQAKRLCILGIFQSPWGPIPFSHAAECDTDDGPIDVGSELPEPVAAAIDQSERTIMANVEHQQVRLAAEDLVDRTNDGDQNAAAMMIMVRDNASKGNPRAQLTLKYMLRYAKGEGKAAMHGETGETTSTKRKLNARVIRVLQKELGPEATTVQYRSAVMSMLPSLSMLEGSVTLSNGPDLDKDRIESVVESLNDQDKKSFLLGFKNWRAGNSDSDATRRLGRIFGLARTIQLVRLPETPIGTLSTAAGLELD